jgi:hypothetical protein
MAVIKQLHVSTIMLSKHVADFLAAAVQTRKIRYVGQPFY